MTGRKWASTCGGQIVRKARTSGGMCSSGIRLRISCTQSLRAKGRFPCRDSASRYLGEIPFASQHGQHRQGLLDRNRLGQFGEDCAQMRLGLDAVGLGGLDQAVEQTRCGATPSRVTPTDNIRTVFTMRLAGDAAQALLPEDWATKS